MKNHPYKKIRHLQHLIKQYRAEKNWLKVDQLKHTVRLAIKEAKYINEKTTGPRR